MRSAFILSSLVVLGCELTIATAVAWQFIGMVPFLTAHTLIFGASVAAALAAPASSHMRSALLHLALWTAIAGPFGAAIAAGLGAFEWSSCHLAADDLGGWLDQQVGSRQMKEVRHLRNELIDQRLRIEGSCNVKPLYDVLAVGEQKEKLDALNVIGRRFDPSLSSTLRLAARDRDASVRVLAATAISKLQTESTDRLTSMRDAAATRNEPDAWLALGIAHHEYGVSGLLLPSQVRDEMKRALACFEMAVKLTPRSDAIEPIFGDLLVDESRPQHALDVLSFGSVEWSSQDQVRHLCEQAQMEIARTMTVVEPTPTSSEGAARFGDIS